MFKKIGKKISEVGQDAIRNTQKLADMATLKSKIDHEEKVINGLYLEIGKLYYNKFGSEPVEDFEQLCSDVTDSLNKISDYQLQMQKLKGKKRCPECGAQVEVSAKFCSTCGSNTVYEIIEDFENDKKCECPNCNNVFEEGTKFCAECGTKIDN